MKYSSKYMKNSQGMTKRKLTHLREGVMSFDAMPPPGWWRGSHRLTYVNLGEQFKVSVKL